MVEEMFLLVSQSQFVNCLQDHIQHGLLILEDLHGESLEDQRNVEQ